MPKSTKEDKKQLNKKLEYIGLDLNNIPDFLKRFEEVEFRPSKSFDEKIYRVYKYLPIKDIQILLTPTDRLALVKEKYSLASPIYSYLIPKNEENIEKHAAFLHMLNKVSIEDIEHIEQLQKILNKDIPFGVKYYENYIWQIYYSKYTDKYFMMLPIKESEYASLFYILKKQLQKSKEKIYVPIRYMDYSEQFLKKNEITDIENYLWLFTKNWPSIYEVYDKNDKMSLQIVGQTYVYKKIESSYKLNFDSRQEAIKFYKLIKALSILQTEIPHIYNFNIKVDSLGNIEFYFKSKKITYDDLPNFINNEYSRLQKEIIKEDKKTIELNNNLEDLKELAKQKDMEYIEKEKQITTYLQCKKTFFGRVKYYMKYRSKKKKKEKVILKNDNKENNKDEKDNLNIEKKENYTIEDLVVISDKYNLKYTTNKNLNLDIKSLEFKIKNIEKKIENATIYINEIDQHKKSIFEFWKFATKDELPQLNDATQLQEDNTKLHKSFDYEDDIEELGEQADKLQRNVLTKKQTDALFLLTTNVINSINILKTNESLDKEKINMIQNNLTQVLEQAYCDKSLFKIEKFDIFGNMSDDKTKVKILGNKKHRENNKDRFRVLNITKDTKKEEYIETLKELLENINQAYGKIQSIYDMDIYCALPYNEKINENDFRLFNINPENAIKESKNIDKLDLYCINIKEGTPLIYFSNIIYYDNYNKTLPLGMDLSDKVLLDLSKFSFKDLDKTEFRVIKYIDEKDLLDVKIKTVNVLKYNIHVKGDKDD